MAFSNQHLNADLVASYSYGKKYLNSISIAGGKSVFQFNNANPVDPRANTFASLYYTRNFLKIYEAWFANATYNAGFGDGFSWSLSLRYQDRMPIENTTNYKWRIYKQRSFTPNYPTELLSENFKRHQAFTIITGISWQPGSKYIELPDRKISLGSKYPVFTLGYTQAFQNIFGSDVKYSKCALE
ncbi:MAG: DUF5686 family protein [Chitinophagaceae bacterium]